MFFGQFITLFVVFYVHSARACLLAQVSVPLHCADGQSYSSRTGRVASQDACFSCEYSLLRDFARGLALLHTYIHIGLRSHEFNSARRRLCITPALLGCPEFLTMQIYLVALHESKSRSKSQSKSWSRTQGKRKSMTIRSKITGLGRFNFFVRVDWEQNPELAQKCCCP